MILMTGFLGSAEAIQTRVSGSGAFLIRLPLVPVVMAGQASGCGTRDYGISSCCGGREDPAV